MCIVCKRAKFVMLNIVYSNYRQIYKETVYITHQVDMCSHLYSYRIFSGICIDPSLFANATKYVHQKICEPYARECTPA